MFARAGLPGATVVWRDILVEGPVARALDDVRGDRVAWLAREYGANAAAYLEDWSAVRRDLDEARGADEVVLWFEQDLFCAPNLWYVVTRLADGVRSLSLVYPAEPLGTTPPSGYPVLFDRRTPLTVVEARAAGTAWSAYTASDPGRAAAIAAGETPALPFVARALRLHLDRLPERATGLGSVERAALEALANGSHAFGDLFRTVAAVPPLREHGIGDLQLAASLRRLASGSRPLVSIGGGREFREWRVERTRHAADTLAGDSWAGPDEHERWIGGIRLGPGHRRWRRDGDALVAIVG